MKGKQSLILIVFVAMGLTYLFPSAHGTAVVATQTRLQTPRPRATPRVTPSTATRARPTHKATPKQAAIPAPVPKRVIRDWFKLSFNAKDFGTARPGANEWYPLMPGFQSVHEGHVNRGHRSLTHRRVFTVTDVYKRIDGVRAITVLDEDFDGGELSEASLDFYAEDKDGNVWYLGSYTEAYEGGRFVNANDGWLAGVQSASAGIAMPHYPRTGTPTFYQARIPGHEVITGRVYKMGQSRCVPFKCYHDVLIISEGEEFKSYARGVGTLATDPNYSGGEQEREDLVNVTHLSARGIAEKSAQALKMDKNARSAASRVYGHSSPAKRSP